jgi:L-cysteine S-thiosulfotransferase
MARTGFLLACLFLAAPALQSVRAEGPLRSSTSLLTDALRERQLDEAVNPGMLWVSEGEELWRKIEGSEGKSCASCHGDAKTSMKGAAAHYPAVDPATGKLFNLELRINRCRSEYQKVAAFPYESEELLALTAYLARQSLGMPLTIKTDGAAAAHYEKGKAFFYQRQGQINLSCAQCHDDNAGRHLRGDIISSGVPTGYPAYRLEWQTLGSLHRRLRACSLGIRAIQFPYGSDEYLNLELFLAKRAEGMLIETPAIRR